MNLQHDLVLLEFVDEAEAYLDYCRNSGRDPSEDHIIALDPTVTICLNRQGISSFNTEPYFSSESHHRSLEKSTEITDWLETRFHVKDELGIEKAYSNGLIWYCRYFIHHMLWLCEILHAALKIHSIRCVLTVSAFQHDRKSPMINDDDRYLGFLSRKVCEAYGISFDTIPMDRKQRRHGIISKIFDAICHIAIRLIVPLHYLSLIGLRRHHPVLMITRSYRMEDLVKQALMAFPNQKWIVSGQIDYKGGLLTKSAKFMRAIGLGICMPRDPIFTREVWPQIFKYKQKVTPVFDADLNNALRDLCRSVLNDKQLFSHHGIYFADHLVNKIESDIAFALLAQYKDTLGLNEMLEAVKPGLIVTPYGRRELYALGELGAKRGVPGMLISHGSFTPVKNKLEWMGWNIHSQGMFYGSFTHGALQSKLSEEFSHSLDTSVRFVRTGPLAWGAKVNRNTTKRIRESLVPEGAGSRIIVHASSPKYRSGMHFHVYETPDEYISGITDLINAVETIPDCFLIVKFRSAFLRGEQLLELLPKSDKFCVSVDEPFLDVLSIANLLVSFSSTTIEEALQNQVPVLLYGGNGRYQHVEATHVTSGDPIECKSVYAVESSDNLSYAVSGILDIYESTTLDEELFNEYIFSPDDTISFGVWTDQIIKSSLD